MSVLKGEGRVPILFGSTSVAVGSRVYHGYLARPDLSGAWPTVVIVPSAWGVTSSIKDVCRRLARRGLAAVAADPYRGEMSDSGADLEAASETADTHSREAAKKDLGDIVRFITNPAGFWSSAQHGFGVLGLGWGGAHAVDLAASAGAAGVALVYAPLDDAVANRLGSFPGAVLGLYGRADDVVPVESVIQARSHIPQSEIVVYDGVGHDFLDDLRDGYDLDAAQDAVERLTAFFEKHLPAAPE